MLKTLFKQICPPIILRVLIRGRNGVLSNINMKHVKILLPPDRQDLNLYWDPEFARELDSWGAGSTWREIQLLMVNCKGRILDIACGTGRVIEILKEFNNLEVYGCDISDLLIQKAIDRGIPPSHLKVCDATKTDYSDNFFDYAYSIGSLEHFTENGILGFLSECHRIVKGTSFHLIPVSRSGKDEGWLKIRQSFYNNSVDWWLNRFKKFFKTVSVLDSVFQDNISIGKWFVCTNNEVA